ncbi:hypothetical protein RIF29_29937 [Crotalaria pallida]|uniref:Uncharacterized protein n=1 Tax=Crotalaria pallida TaxID=3830 RepID=A0AAN9EHS5_CROPI
MLSPLSLSTSSPLEDCRMSTASREHHLPPRVLRVQPSRPAPHRLCFLFPLDVRVSLTSATLSLSCSSSLQLLLSHHRSSKVLRFWLTQGIYLCVYIII